MWVLHMSLIQFSFPEASSACISAPVADTKPCFAAYHSTDTTPPAGCCPMQVWFYRVGSEVSDAVLLWHETDPAFYLSLSRTSSGRYLVLSAASEVSCVVSGCSCCVCCCT
jgi:hypothetical protein